MPRPARSWNAVLTWATVLCPVILGLVIGWWLKNRRWELMPSTWPGAAIFDKLCFLKGNTNAEPILVEPNIRTARAITPQKPPTSPRIKSLLSRALTAPATLTPAEMQEIAASVVYHLISHEKN